MNNTGNSEYWTMTGTEAKAHVQKLKNNPSKYGSVTIKMYLACNHVEKIEDEGKYEEDTYGGSEWGMNTTSIELRWKDFLNVCAEADTFSKLKKARFEEVGRDDTSAEHGTGITLRTHHNSNFNYTMVLIT